MNAEPFELGVLDAAEHLASGTVTSVELMRALLDRADQVEPSLNSLCWRDRELALVAAREADEARAAGDARPWLGVPLAVKDVLNVAGQPCTAGSAILQGYVAPYDATVVARLKAAGFILFARANTDEFAMGSSTETSVYGPTRNPWDAERTPSGLERGVRRGGGRAAGACRSGHRYQRQHSPARRFLRCDRFQADHGPDFALWLCRSGAIAGSDWRHCPECRGCRRALSGHGRGGPA